MKQTKSVWQDYLRNRKEEENQKNKQQWKLAKDLAITAKKSLMEKTILQSIEEHELWETRPNIIY